MTTWERPVPMPSTSAGGAMSRPKPGLLIVGGLIAGFGTSVAPAVPVAQSDRWHFIAPSTSSGTTLAPEPKETATISELRRISGLTWAQLARLFQVSPRTLHFWASGKRMTPSHEEHLQRTLGVVRRADRGSAGENRAMLLRMGPDGRLPFDLLAEKQYEQGLAVLGARVDGPRPLSMPQKTPRPDRAPRPPGELVDALQDRVQPASGRLLSAKPIKLPRRP